MFTVAAPHRGAPSPRSKRDDGPVVREILQEHGCVEASVARRLSFGLRFGALVMGAWSVRLMWVAAGEIVGEHRR